MESRFSTKYSRVLVTGANGQLGSELRKLLVPAVSEVFFFTDIDTLNITKESAISNYFKTNKPELVVNCAAYTAVDKAEQESDLAYLINAKAPEILAKEAHAIGANMIHISTDYVFDGKSYTPYHEGMPTSANSIYGKSKDEGEKAAAKFGNTMIIRTSWLYSAFGNNFLKTILKKGEELPELNVVFDQVGSPTWAHDLAKAILTIIKKGKELFKPEIFHYSNEGVCSWYDFAKEIALEANLKCKINAILSSQYPTAAVRPPFSVLDKSKIKNIYDVEVPHWRESLINCIKTI